MSYIFYIYFRIFLKKLRIKGWNKSIAYDIENVKTAQFELDIKLLAGLAFEYLYHLCFQKHFSFFAP